MNFSNLYIFICIIFVGKGDDQRKRRSKAITSGDIGILEESQGIEKDTWILEHILATQNSRINALHKRMKLRKFNRENLRDIKSKGMDKITPQKINNSVYSPENTKNVSEEFSFGLFKLYNSNESRSNQIIDTIPKWPKFEDLLLSIGVEYNWKSDRWIKIKDKVTKTSDDDLIFFNKHKEISHKHEFKYRTVRVNGSKNRKNVIIAVTAVR